MSRVKEKVNGPIKTSKFGERYEVGHLRLIILSLTTARIHGKSQVLLGIGDCHVISEFHHTSAVKKEIIIIKSDRQSFTHFQVDF